MKWGKKVTVTNFPPPSPESRLYGQEFDESGSITQSAPDRRRKKNPQTSSRPDRRVTPAYSSLPFLFLMLLGISLFALAWWVAREQEPVPKVPSMVVTTPTPEPTPESTDATVPIPTPTAVKL